MGLAGASRLDLAAAVRVRRATPGKPLTASLGDRAEIDDGKAGAGAVEAQATVDRIGSTTLPWICTITKRALYCDYTAAGKPTWRNWQTR